MKYSLYSNKLKTGKKGSCIAKIKSHGCVDLNALVLQMCSRGSTITKSDAMAALNDFFGAIVSSLKNGQTVSLPLFKIRPSIRGQFIDSTDFFDKNRHQLLFTVSSGKILKQLPEEIKLEKSHRRAAGPWISDIYDSCLNSKVKTFKSRMVLEVKGGNFYFPQESDDVGIFVIHGKDQIKTQILKRIDSGNVMIMLPDKLLQPELQLKVVVKIPHHVKATYCVSDYIPVDATV